MHCLHGVDDLMAVQLLPDLGYVSKMQKLIRLMT